MWYRIDIQRSTVEDRLRIDALLQSIAEKYSVRPNPRIRIYAEMHPKSECSYYIQTENEALLSYVRSVFPSVASCEEPNSGELICLW